MTRILAYRLSAFGDVAMTVPVLKEFLMQNKDVEIVMISRKNFANLFDGIPRLTFKGINVEEHKGYFKIRQLALELIKDVNPNYIADLHDVIRTKIFNSVFNRKGFNVYKIDKGKEEKAQLTDVWNLNKKPLKQTTERYADVFREMGFSVTLSHQLPENKYPKKGIGIAPFAQHKGKMLPLEKTFEIAKILSERNEVYLFGGGENEIETLNDWETKIPNITNYAGKLSLEQELEKIASLELMISMDSANMHLASLVGTRCVSIWGATHPFAGFLGYGQCESDIVQIKDLTCRPCSVFGDKACFRDDWACLEEVNIQWVIDKVQNK